MFINCFLTVLLLVKSHHCSGVPYSNGALLQLHLCSYFLHILHILFHSCSRFDWVIEKIANHTPFFIGIWFPIIMRVIGDLIGQNSHQSNHWYFEANNWDCDVIINQITKSNQNLQYPHYLASVWHIWLRIWLIHLIAIISQII